MEADLWGLMELQKGGLKNNKIFWPKEMRFVYITIRASGTNSDMRGVFSFLGIIVFE